MSNMNALIADRVSLSFSLLWEGVKVLVTQDSRMDILLMLSRGLVYPLRLLLNHLYKLTLCNERFP